MNITVERIIVSVIGALFQSFAATYILKTQAKMSKKDLIKFNLYIFVLDIICSLFVPNNFRFMFSLITLTTVLYFALNVKDRKAIIYSFIIMTILPLSEIITSICMVLFGVKSNVIVENNYVNLLANIIISLVAIALINIPYIKKLLAKITRFLTSYRKAIYYLVIFMVLLYLIVTKNGLEFIFKSNYYVNIVITVVVLIIILLVIIGDTKNEQLKEINKQSINYIKKYEKIITEQGKANHEFKNQLMVIRGYAQMKSSKLMEYLDSVIDDTKKMKSTYLISQLNKFPEGGIKGLLYYKLSIMEEEGIKYSIYSEENIKRKAKSLTPEQMKNITKVLGVLIDNAIDECKLNKEKNIDISLTSERGKMIFSISNTINNKASIKMFGTGFSTKGKSHGYGLQLVNDIITTSDYIEYDCKVENNEYIVTVIIKTGNKKTYKNNL